MDREGNLLDAMVVETCDLETAKQFFAHALAVAGTPPQRVYRLVRASSSFSKKLASHIDAIKNFICDNKLTRAASLPA